MKRTRPWLVLVLGLAAGCTPAMRYEFVREAGEAKARCDEMRTARAEADCRASYQMTWEDYVEARRASRTE